MSEPDHNSHRHAQVAAWLNSGVTVPEIERRLTEGGLTQEEAFTIVDAALSQKVSAAAASQRRKDRVTLIGGIALCLLGVLLLGGGIAGFLYPEMDLVSARAPVNCVGGGAGLLGGGVILIIRSVI